MKPIAIDDVKVMDLGLGRSIYSPEQQKSLCVFRRARELVAHSWLRAQRGPTTPVLEVSGARVFPTWPLRI
jgi:hypothetical protein